MRVLACVLALVALVFVSSGGAVVHRTCPGDASLGSISFPRAGKTYVVPLSTCLAKSTGAVASSTDLLPGVRTSARQARVQRIWVNGRLVFSHTESGPIVPLNLSGDRRWLFFTVDPDSSASIAADGLDVRVVSTHGGAVHHLGVTLTYRDYLTWCGGRLVYAQGLDRIAIHGKRLLEAGPPDWRPRPLWNDRKLTFASPACTPDGSGVVVLVQRSSVDARFFATRWQLWRVGLDGSRRELDAPPPGFADESPTWSPDGTSLLFVRERNGYGRLMLLRDRVLFGPFANLGYSLGFYGHHDWGLTWRR